MSSLISRMKNFYYFVSPRDAAADVVTKQSRNILRDRLYKEKVVILNPDGSQSG